MRRTPNASRGSVPARPRCDACMNGHSREEHTRAHCDPEGICCGVDRVLAKWDRLIGSVQHGSNRACRALEFVDFCMSIRKGEAACAAVIRSRQITPLLRRSIRMRIGLQEAVVDAVGMFIHGYEQLRWIANTGRF